jgi:perosamine synthetase
MYKIPSYRPYFDDVERRYVDEAFDSRLSATLSFVDSFEKSFSRYAGRKYAVAVSNGTAGLHLLVKYIVDRKKGGIVATPLTFVASANVILYENQEIIFSDIGADLLLDEDKLERLLETRKGIIAIIYVDIFGIIPKNGKVREICDRRGIFLIEDASQALGSQNGSVIAGRLGHAAVFSFNKNKQITSGGEGGMIVTDDEDIRTFCVSIRDQGRVNGENWIERAGLGNNYRMTEIQAAIGCAQLEKVDGFLKKRRELVSAYADLLRGLQHVSIASGTNDTARSWFIFYVLVDDAILRERLIRELSDSGVECKTNYFPPVYRFKSYKGIDFSSPLAEKFYAEVIALPLYVEMTRDDIEFIAGVIRKCCNE